MTEIQPFAFPASGPLTEAERGCLARLIDRRGPLTEAMASAIRDELYEIWEYAHQHRQEFLAGHIPVGDTARAEVAARLFDDGSDDQLPENFAEKGAAAQPYAKAFGWAFQYFEGLAPLIFEVGNEAKLPATVGGKLDSIRVRLEQKARAGIALTERERCWTVYFEHQVKGLSMASPMSAARLRVQMFALAVVFAVEAVSREFCLKIYRNTDPDGESSRASAIDVVARAIEALTDNGRRAPVSFEAVKRRFMADAPKLEALRNGCPLLYETTVRLMGLLSGWKDEVGVWRRQIDFEFAREELVATLLASKLQLGRNR